MSYIRVTCPVCFKDHNAFIPLNSAVRLADLSCNSECYTVMMDRMYGGPPTRKLPDPASTPPSTIVNRGFRCKNCDVTAETCRVGVRADPNARNQIVKLGVVRGNPCPLEGVADRDSCPEYK
jgi:hypothetical protein